MQEFEVSGGYSHGDHSGAFNGNFRIYKDGRLLGVLEGSRRETDHNEKDSRLVLGLLNNSNMNFWKFSPNLNFAPLVYTLRLEGERYTGKWAPIRMPISVMIRGEAGLVELPRAFDSDDIENTLNILTEIKIERVKRLFSHKMLKDILANSPYLGYLTLNRVQSFAF